MRSKTILTGMALILATAGPCLAGDAQLGTWKLNEARSRLNPALPKNTTVVYTGDGDRVKITVDGVDKDGKPTHNEWTGKFDGKDYPVTGDPNSDTRAYTKVDDRTLSFTVKKGGKVTITGRIVTTPSGKGRTVTTMTTGTDGRKTVNLAFYDRQ